MPAAQFTTDFARKQELPPIQGQDHVAHQAANGKMREKKPQQTQNARLRNSLPEIACFK